MKEKESKKSKMNWSANKIHTPQAILAHYSTHTLHDIFLISQEMETEWAHWAADNDITWPQKQKKQTYPYQRTIVGNAAIPTAYMRGYGNSNGKGWHAICDPPADIQQLQMPDDETAMYQGLLLFNLNSKQ